jgi:hypothetical protein
LSNDAFREKVKVDFEVVQDPRDNLDSFSIVALFSSINTMVILVVVAFTHVIRRSVDKHVSTGPLRIPDVPGSISILAIVQDCSCVRHAAVRPLLHD